MADIGRELGVSASTVSRALARHPGIPEKTRAKVRAAAERMGYRPDPVMSAVAARRWARDSRQAGAGLGFVFLGSGVQVRSDPVLGARDLAQALGYRLEVFSVTDKATASQVQRVLRARGIRGVILRYANAEAQLPDWDWRDLVVVICGEPPREAPAVDLVDLAVTDNHQRIARECLARGLRRPAILMAGPEWLRSEHRRLSGLTTPFLEAGEAAPPFRWWNGEKVGALRQWLKEERVDAVVAMIGRQVELLQQAGAIGAGRLPYACMQLMPHDPVNLAGIRSDFRAMGEMSARLCDMGIRQNRFGLPASPTMTLVQSRWQAGTSLERGDQDC